MSEINQDEFEECEEELKAKIEKCQKHIELLKKSIPTSNGKKSRIIKHSKTVQIDAHEKRLTELRSTLELINAKFKDCLACAIRRASSF